VVFLEHKFADQFLASHGVSKIDFVSVVELRHVCDFRPWVVGLLRTIFSLLRLGLLLRTCHHEGMQNDRGYKPVSPKSSMQRASPIRDGTILQQTLSRLCRLGSSALVMFLLVLVAAPIAQAEVWEWNEAPIIRTVQPGGSLVIDLRSLGYGDEGGAPSTFTFTVSPVSERLPGFTDNKPTWIAHSAGVLTASNAVAGTYSFTMKARKTSGPVLSGRVGVRVVVNSPPVAVNDAYTQTHATTVDHNVLANDSDPNGDTRQPAAVCGAGRVRDLCGDIYGVGR